MRSTFLQEFAVDQNAVIAEVRTMRCQDQDVAKYTDEFNAKVSKLRSSDPGLRQHLKILYVDGLPFKLKEILFRDKAYQHMDLPQAQVEAKRQHSVNVYMNRGRKPFDQNQNQNNDDKDQKDQKDGKNQNQNQGQ